MKAGSLTGLIPPFTRETAIQKVRLAEDSWNSWDPEKVCLGMPALMIYLSKNLKDYIIGRSANVLRSLTELGL